MKLAMLIMRVMLNTPAFFSPSSFIAAYLYLRSLVPANCRWSEKDGCFGMKSIPNMAYSNLVHVFHINHAHGSC